MSKTYNQVCARYFTEQIFNCEFDIRKAYSWWIKYGTLYVQWTEEQEKPDEYDESGECASEYKEPEEVDIFENLEWTEYSEGVHEGSTPSIVESNPYCNTNRYEPSWKTIKRLRTELRQEKEKLKSHIKNNLTVLKNNEFIISKLKEIINNNGASESVRSKSS